MDYYRNGFSTKSLLFSGKNNNRETSVEQLLFSAYTKYCNICHPIFTSEQKPTPLHIFTFKQNQLTFHVLSVFKNQSLAMI